MCVLELSKVLMYEFHYDYIKNRYDNKSKLLFTDTDSLMWEIKTEDVYEDFSSNKEMFDFSNYSTKSKQYDGSNKLVIGKMKDETGGFASEELVGLKPKMYQFLVDDNSEHKKAKGVNRNVVAKIIHSKYKDALFNNKCLRHSMNRIQSKIYKQFMKLTKFHCLFQITKYIFKTMDMIDQLLVIRVNHKETVILVTI